MADSLPLDGLTVLDVSSFIAAPAAAVVLGDFGANVIKVEPPGDGDPHRVSYKLPHLPQSETNYPWHLDARNKRSVALDLKHADGRKILDRLIARADVLIINYPFPVRERLRLRFEDVSPGHPRLIYASFSGYGEHGAEKDRPGFDTNAYFSRAGIVDSARYEGQPPAFGLPAQGDRASAMGFVSGILMALLMRERTGRGGHVASSLFANGLWSNGMIAQAALVDAFIGPRPPPDRPRNAVTNLYATSDGLWLQISAVREDKVWPALCAALGQPSLEADPRFTDTARRRANAVNLATILDRIFRTRTRTEWIEVLTEYAVPHAPIARAQEIPSDEQAAAACAVVASTCPDMPRTLAAPFQIGGVTPRMPGAGPSLGEHTTQVLSEAGFDPDEIERLRAAKVIT